MDDKNHFGYILSIRLKREKLRRRNVKLKNDQKKAERDSWRRVVKSKKVTFRYFNPILLNILKQLSKSLGGYKKYPVYREFAYPDWGHKFSTIGRWSICKNGSMNSSISFDLKEEEFGKLKLRFTTNGFDCDVKEDIDASEKDAILAIKHLEGIENW